MEIDGDVCATLHRMNPESTTGKVKFEQRTKRYKGLSHVDMKGKSILGWQKSKCKNPKKRKCLTCMIKSKKPVSLEYLEPAEGREWWKMGKEESREPERRIWFYLNQTKAIGRLWETSDTDQIYVLKGLVCHLFEETDSIGARVESERLVRRLLQ